MSAYGFGLLTGSVLGAVLIPIVIFVLLRNLLGLTPLKRRVGLVHGMSAPIALFGALASVQNPRGVLLVPLSLCTTSAFVVWSYRRAKAAAKQKQ